jgi:hypothetical protein
MAIKQESEPVRCARCTRLTKTTTVYRGDVVCVPCKVKLDEGS